MKALKNIIGEKHEQTEKESKVKKQSSCCDASCCKPVDVEKIIK